MAGVAVLLALLSALSYGASDFLGGVGGRRGDPFVVALVSQVVGLGVASLAVVLLTSHTPTAASLGWGALAGVGVAVGTVSLYRGFAAGQMSVVAPLSGVLTAAIPAVVGIALGEHLAPLTLAGIALAIPAVLLVSMSPGGQVRSEGVVEGVLAGVGFGGILIALSRAGTQGGAWPLVPCDAVSSALTLAVILLARRRRQELGRWRMAASPAIGAGLLGGAATVLYLFATGKGQLSVVGVLTALYPTSTVLLARFVLHEGWSRLQVVGLVAAAAAVGMISG
jgi:uncharacterized membrane protein